MKKITQKLLLVMLTITLIVIPLFSTNAQEDSSLTEISELPAPQNAPEIVEQKTEVFLKTPEISDEKPMQNESQLQESVYEPQNTGVQDFVTRMYKVCLGRTPDSKGLQEWSDALINGTATGANVAHGFIFSQEFINKNLSDTEYIKALYNAFFGREADSGGLSAWQNVINEGYSRKYLLSGFVNSDEFTALCNNYGIQRGQLELSPVELTPSISVFVARFYKLCLQRDADEQGLSEWTQALQSKLTTGAQVAYGFVFSPEFLARNLSNEEYVKIMYKAFFGREADPTGLQSWISALNNGTHRQNVLAGFTNSNEFSILCQKYDIDRGTLENYVSPAPNPSPNPNPVPNPTPDVNSRYQSIFDEYSAKLRNTTPRVVAEFNAEYPALNGDINAISNLLIQKIDIMATIVNEGVGEMAKVHIYYDPDNYSTYESWAFRLMDVYIDECDALWEAFYNAM